MANKFSDRVSTNTSRRKLKIVSQTDSEVVADIERADENILNEGTPITAEALNAFDLRIETSETNAINAVTNAKTAVNTATSATTVAEDAKTLSTLANANASSAVETANQANITANTALEKATQAEATVAENVKTITINGYPVDNLYFDTDPQSQINLKAEQADLDDEITAREEADNTIQTNIDNILNNNVNISNTDGGISACLNAKASGTSIALGLNAKTSYEKTSTDTATNEEIVVVVGTGNVAIGENAQSFSGDNGKSVAIGSHSVAGISDNSIPADGAVAVGDSSAAASLGVAVGKSTKAIGKKSVAIGNSAIANSEESIQLGQGTNNVSKSLQVFEDNIYDASSHTLKVQNITLNGVDLASKISNATGGTSSAIALDLDVDLNNYNTELKLGYYYADAGNTILNKPLNVDSFALEIGRSATNSYYQLLIATLDNDVKYFIRESIDGIWTSWGTLAKLSDLATYLPVSGGNIVGDLSFGDGNHKITNNGANYTGTAENAIKDGIGNVISDTYAKVTLNNATSKEPTFFAPTTVGAKGQVLKSSGNGEPEWGTLSRSDISDLDSGLTEIPQATNTTLGGIKAEIKTINETEEVKLDTTTGKLYSKTIPTSLPASDVSAWAKATSKPTYSYSEIANTPSIPTTLAELGEDANHRLVTDVEKAIWNSKIEQSQLITKTSQLENDSDFTTNTILTEQINSAKSYADSLVSDNTESINQNKTDITAINTNLSENYYTKTDLNKRIVPLHSYSYLGDNTWVVQPIDNYYGRIELTAGHNNQCMIAINTKAAARADGFRGLAIGNYDIAIQDSLLKYKNTTSGTTWNFDDVVVKSDIQNLSTITLNGTSTTNASFYAPTSVGTAGCYLKSNGTGAPTWEEIPKVVVDSVLSSTSTNPLQNKVIASNLNSLSTKVDTAVSQVNTIVENASKRINYSPYTGSTTWYYPIAKLPIDNSGNYASITISGRIGGWIKGNMSFINALVSNRDGDNGVFSCVGNDAQTALSVADIVLYRQSDNSTIVYLKVTGYASFDLNVNLSGCDTSAYLYNGSYVTTPTGTLGWSASTGSNRLMVYGGNAYVGGKQLATVSEIDGILKTENDVLNLYIGETKVASITKDGELKVKTLNLVDSL